MIDNVADPGAVEALTCADFERAYIIDRRAHHTPMVRRNGKPEPYASARSHAHCWHGHVIGGVVQ